MRPLAKRLVAAANNILKKSKLILIKKKAQT
jgi:hypothetical protein